MLYNRLMPIACAAAIAALIPACGGSSETAPPATINVLSSRASLATGGSALVEIPLPANVPTGQVKVLRNGVDVTSSFSARDAHTLIGVVEGLTDGNNEVQAVNGSGGPALAMGSIKSSPVTGPLFAGPHQRPWICETEASGLGAPTSSSVCTGNSKVEWFYRTTAGTFAPLTQLSQPYPGDLAKTTTIEGASVNYIVRVESGTIDESIYRIAILDDPAKPISKPWSANGTKPGAGWNGKLMYQYVGGAGPGYRSGSNSASGALLAQDSIRSVDDALNMGFAVATGTRNVFGTGQDDALSAETTAMIKEHFIKNYGLPKFTIGLGSSGGSMQLHLISQNYPGLLDGIIPVRTFPDQVSIVSDVLDCNVLTNYFTKAPAGSWPVSKISKVDGYPVVDNSTTCLGLWQNYANVWQNPSNTQFGSSVPTALRYNASTNPKGARGDYWSGNVNSFGVNPANGFARSAYDNVGVQYGLNALNSGAISTTEFLDLNEKVGGLDIDGKITTSRSSGDLQAIGNAYKSGRLNSAMNLTLPMIDYRNYVDEQRNIHARDRTFAKIERMLKTNGTRDNMVAWTVAGTPAPGTNLIRQSLTAMNEWLEKLSADPANLSLDRSSREYLSRVIAAKPATAKDTCWDAAGTKFEEALTLDPAAQCNKLYPIYANPRIAAGGPRAGDILKCQLKPVTTADYKVTYTAPELARLNAIFPSGVCDWSKPGVNQSLPDGVWLSFGQVPGTWSVLGR